MSFDPRPMIQALVELVALIHGALSFDTQSVAGAQQVIGLRIAYGIIFLAGISEGVGTQSVVLFVNRLSRRNFLLNLLLSGAVYVIGAMAWIISISVIARFLFHDPRPLLLVVRVVSLGYLPLLFGFFVLAPYLGPGLLYLLHAWSFLIVLLVVGQVFDMLIWQAFVCTFGGWLIVQLSRRTVSRPLAIVDRWLWSMTTGAPTRFDLDDIPVVLPLPTAGAAASLEGTP